MQKFPVAINATAFILEVVFCMVRVSAQEPPARTTLSRKDVAYTIAEQQYVVLTRGDIEAVVVDNNGIDDSVLPGHRAGYHGLGSLKHRLRPENCFVPAYAGLNFEHIHDGTTQERKILFEPRMAPMELRVIDRYTVELYQPPTPTWKLESALRYEVLEDGALQMTVECIPWGRSFRRGYIGLFWASYIDRPESTIIHFWGIEESRPGELRWIKAFSPRHGVASTHPGVHDLRVFTFDETFPLTLVFNRSSYRYAEPWYFGITKGMALLFVFRPKDHVWFAQSPSGGGQGNPAWDFQYFIEPYQVGQRYQMVMRLVYVPYQSHEQVRGLAHSHLSALAALE